MRNFVFNKAMELRRDTLKTIVSLYEKDLLREKFPKLVRKILPGDNPVYRNNIYREREILKQRIKIYLDFDYEKTRDLELFELVDHLDSSFFHKNDELRGKHKYVRVIKEACDVCPSGKFYATDLCRNCIAHNCTNVCPRDAIVFEEGRAKIIPEKCIGCGLCAKSCDYYAIVKLERPCERACSLDAITKDEKGAADIDMDKCVACGACHVACPFGAIESPTQVLDTVHAIKNKEEIIAIYAPAIVSQFGHTVSAGKIKTLFKKLGFSDAIEAAVGADMVAEEEAEMINNNPDKMTTSCCPAFYSYIKKHQPNMEKYISHAPSPMAALAEHLKDKYPYKKIAFIGPCIAKKMEADKYNFLKNKKIIDYVLTFTDVASWIDARGWDLSALYEDEVLGTSFGWGFAHTGGVANAVSEKLEKDVTVIHMNGLAEGKESFAAFEKAGDYTLLEGMGCRGGCIAGPSILQNPKVARVMLMKVGSKK
ncbi:monomeric [FeFe] hydrogenase [uncultured Ilyobacter sp.]|uniref:monomeric [FeFe] hydrogenase n=1 Tax=uncultured Ilyobacter sp. TaxID=544433 RepID=UPI0029C7CAB5|nr:monomeric [FeFe] hydrogenase [uncultured Ilyobacter sp.]